MELKSIKLSFIGEPVAKGAVKHVFARGKMHGFRPAKTSHAMDDLRAQLKPQLPAGWTPIQGAIRMRLVFSRTKPKSLSKKIIYPTTRSDIDNYIKLVLDSLNTVVFRDDAQIIEIYAKKEYSENPNTTVEVEEI